MVKAIVGANWGDEGKGKITDMFAEASDVHERYKLCGVLWNKGADKHERRI